MSKTTLSYNDILALTGKDGTFFKVGFTKRPKKLGVRALARGEIQATEGDYREFTCRFGVRKGTKGVGPKYDREVKNILCVWVPKVGLNTEDQALMADEQNGDFRSIPCENLKVLNTHGKRYVVEDSVLVEQYNA